MMVFTGTPAFTCADGAHHYTAHPLRALDGSVIWVCSHGPHARTWDWAWTPTTTGAPHG